MGGVTESEIERIIREGLKAYPVKSVKIADKRYNLHIFFEDEDLNVFDGFLFVKPKDRGELSYLISRYQPPLGGYAPRFSLLIYNGQLIIKDYRRNKRGRKILAEMDKTFVSKLKKAILKPTEANFNELFSQLDTIETTSILHRKVRA